MHEKLTQHNREQYERKYSRAGDTHKINYPLKNVLVLEVEIKFNGLFFPPFSLPPHTHTLQMYTQAHTHTHTHTHSNIYTKPGRVRSAPAHIITFPTMIIIEPYFSEHKASV